MAKRIDRAGLQAKAEAFRKLHDGPGILILPNAWDIGSAVVLAAAGFPAIATTSAGVAFAQGYPDGERIGRDGMLAVCGGIAARLDVPVTADLEAGYGPRPEDVAETVRRAIDAGLVGANIEDSDPSGDRALFDLPLAAERIRAGREAADAAGVPFVINARTDSFLLGRPGREAFAESVRRANAYGEAGARSLFVPGVADAPTIGELAREIAGPLNILAGAATPPLGELQALGVARVSIGGALTRATLGLVKRAAEELLGPGTFGFARDAYGHAELNRLFARGTAAGKG